MYKKSKLGNFWQNPEILDNFKVKFQGNDEVKKRVQETIVRAFNIQVKFAQATGYFPFVIDENNSISTNHRLNFPLFLTWFHQISQIAIFILHHMTGRWIFKGTLGEKFTATEKTSFLLMGSVVYLTGFLIRCSNHFKRNKIASFWGQLNDIIVDLICLNEEKYMISIRYWTKRSRRLFYFSIILGTCSIIRGWNFFQHIGEIDQASMILILISMITDIACSLHVAFIFLISYCINMVGLCMEFTLSELEKLEQIVKSQNEGITFLGGLEYEVESTIEKFLAIYKKLGHLTEDQMSNDIFPHQILASIFSINAVILLLVFFSILWQDQNILEIFGRSAILFINILSFYIVCHRSTILSLNSEKVARKLQEIASSSHLSSETKLRIEFVYLRALAKPFALSPGQYYTVNRRFFTAVCSALTTYLVILLQFRRGE